MLSVNKDETFTTTGGRVVYGGGGIIPDVFVPMDTTRATDFYIKCNRKATMMRFASDVFDKEKASLSKIDDFQQLKKYMDGLGLEGRFLSYASSHDGITPGKGEWEASKLYMMTQIYALVGRYSKLGDNAFYRFYLDTDDTYKTALESPSRVKL